MYDIWTGKVSVKKMKEYATTKGIKKLSQIKAPILQTKNGILVKVLPGTFVKTAEPILQSVAEYRKTTIPKGIKVPDFDTEGNPRTFVGLLIQTLKLCGPEKIVSFFQLWIGITVFFYILILSKLFKVDGIKIVNRPKYSGEYIAIHQIISGERGSPKKSIESKKKE